MPALISHYMFGKELNKLLKYQNDLEDAFLWGNQGPDFLLFHFKKVTNKSKALNQLSTMLHKSDVPQLYSVMFELAKIKKENAIYLAYLNGLIAHHVLDALSHPYVFSMQDKLIAQNNGIDNYYHNEIESILDIIILRYFTGELPSEFKIKNALPKNIEVLQVMTEIYEYLFNKLFDIEVPKKEILKSALNMRTAQKWLKDKTGFKRELIYSFEKRFIKKNPVSNLMKPLIETNDFDYANISNEEWQDKSSNPPQIKATSYIELFEDALKTAKSSINSFNISIISNNLSFSQIFINSFKAGEKR